MRYAFLRKHYRKGETDSAWTLSIAGNASICCPLLGLQTTFFICGCLILTGELMGQSFVFSLYALLPMFFLN